MPSSKLRRVFNCFCCINNATEQAGDLQPLNLYPAGRADATTGKPSGALPCPEQGLQAWQWVVHARHQALDPAKAQASPCLTAQPHPPPRPRPPRSQSTSSWSRAAWPGSACGAAWAAWSRLH